MTKRYYIAAYADGHIVHQWAASANNALQAFEVSIKEHLHKLPHNCPVKVCVEMPKLKITVTFNIQVSDDD